MNKKFIKLGLANFRKLVAVYFTYCKSTKTLVEYVYMSKMACNCCVWEF